MPRYLCCKQALIDVVHEQSIDVPAELFSELPQGHLAYLEPNPTLREISMHV